MEGHALQHDPGHDEGGQAERHVDPEDQRPVDLLGEEAAQHRPAHRRGRKHRGDITLVAPALAWADDVGDDGLRQRHQRAAAETLEAAREYERGHARRQRRGNGADDEQADGDQHHHAPAVHVGKLAVERHHRRAGDEIGGHHPGQIAEVAEVLADGGQRGGDDGLVERAEEHRQHDADDDRQDFLVAEAGKLVVVMRRVRGGRRPRRFMRGAGMGRLAAAGLARASRSGTGRGHGRRFRMIPIKPVPDAIGDGNRFSEKIMRRQCASCERLAMGLREGRLCAAFPGRRVAFSGNTAVRTHGGVPPAPPPAHRSPLPPRAPSPARRRRNPPGSSAADSFCALRASR